MMFLAFVPAIPIIIMAFFLPYKRIIWIISVVAATTSLIFLFVDSQIFQCLSFILIKQYYRLFLIQIGVSFSLFPDMN